MPHGDDRGALDKVTALRQASALKVMAQLAFGGQCRQAFEHYEKVLGGKISVMNLFGDTDAKLPPGSTAAASDQVRFAELQIGEFAILGNDVPEQDFQPMRGFNIAVHVSTAAEAQRIFTALSDGGRIGTPLCEVAWSSAFGMVTDRFGTPWLVLALDRDGLALDSAHRQAVNTAQCL